MPSVKLQQGIFTDGGYRYRENVFTKSDNYFSSFISTKQKFYDTLHFNTDEFKVSEDYTPLAKINFRLQPDMLTHTLTDFSFIDWLGSIAGINYLLIDLVIYFFGSYTAFNGVIESYNAL